jgi:hypothetical protein
LVVRDWAALCMAGAIRAGRRAGQTKPLPLESKGLAARHGDAGTGTSRLTKPKPSFSPSKANDDKLLVFMVVKCCFWERCGWVRGV